MKLLTTADAIRSSIRRLFADHSKANVAVVAFIGRDALEYLPDNIAGTQIYCWPKAGGTHPDAIGERVAAGAIVRFVEGLHSKVYWSPTGAIIGSANLTKNALGGHGLYETAVLVPSKDLPIRTITGSLRVEPDFKGRLAKLYRDHAIFCQRNPDHDLGVGRRKTKVPTYREWYQSAASSFDWRYLQMAEEAEKAPQDTVQELEEVWGDSAKDFLAVESKQDLGQGVPTLCFRLSGSGSSAKVSDLSWWVPEHLARTKAKQWKLYSFVWFGRTRMPRGTSPPFLCSDRRFKKALERVIGKSDPSSRIWQRTKPDSNLRKALFEAYE